jgi:methylornithine synthase
MKSELFQKLLTKSEIVEILKNKNEAENDELFRLAQAAREKVFGRKIFLYGFVYFSTWCRNDCSFCYFRRSNPIPRYRKSPEAVTRIAKQLAESGVHLIDLTMGEDLKYHQEDFQTVLDIVDRIKTETKLPVMISPGVIPDSLTDRFASAGTDWYALYQETHNRDLFKTLRLNQDYDERMNGKLHARNRGMLIEEGLLAGVGESYEDIADSLFEMGRIQAGQIRVMSFIPQKGSPMEDIKTPDRMLERKIIALMRLMYPYALIPASLDVDGIKGLKDRINAGANVVTSIIPPKSGLMGVAQSSMDVDEGGRTAKEAESILTEMDLSVASLSEYMEYLEILKRRQKADLKQEVS